MKKGLLIIVLFFHVGVFAQNTAITDSETYNAHSSAMLDVYSTTKGVLLPRLTTDEMMGIVIPAAGLMVFNSDSDQYYFYTGTNWLPVSGAEYFQTKGDTVFITGDGMRMGVGDASPMSRLSVKGDPTAISGEPLFEVKNSTGDVIFAVYEDEVKVNFIETAKGNKGGFAVGGLSPGKGVTNEYLRITPDSVRVYVKDDIPKGNKGGFAVGGLSPGKSGVNNFLDLTPDNYFIGHQAGANTIPGTGNDGRYNSFFGYEAGMNNETGYQNIFVGYNAGKGNMHGFWNTFLGVEAGSVNTGSDNTFIGYKAGRSHQTKGGNVHLGSKAGENATNGEQNIFIGESAGSYTTNGSQNVFMGFQSGYLNSGYTSLVAPEDTARGSFNVYIGHETGLNGRQANRNVFIGYKAGRSTYNNSSPDLYSGSQNVFIGNEAGHSNTTGYSNVFIGNKAGFNATRWESVFIGNEAGYSTTTPVRNVFIGNEAGRQNVIGQYNTYIGDRAGRNSTGTWNTIIGGLAATTNDFGNSNVIIGYVAGRDIVSAQNVMIGHATGSTNSGSIGGNIFIGYRAGNTLTSADKRLAISYNDAPILIYGELDAGRVAINGTTTGGNTFYVNGTAGGTSAWSTKSDVSKKSNIEGISGALDKVLKLNGVSFLWNDNTETGRQLGFNGQEVKEILPELVGNEKSGFAIQYGAMSAVLVEAIKEQQKQIDDLKKANEKLEELVNELLDE